MDRISLGAGRLDHHTRPLGGGPPLAARAQKQELVFEDFIWFLLSEEDKSTPTAIEYWFRCLDRDGDGQLSLYELEFFYLEQQARLQSISMESLAVSDTVCQLLDAVHPAQPHVITLADLKRCQLAPLFFDTLFNAAKFVLRETKHPSAIREERARPKMRCAAQPGCRCRCARGAMGTISPALQSADTSLAICRGCAAGGGGRTVTGPGMQKKSTTKWR